MIYSEFISHNIALYDTSALNITNYAKISENNFSIPSGKKNNVKYPLMPITVTIEKRFSPFSAHIIFIPEPYHLCTICVPSVHHLCYFSTDDAQEMNRWYTDDTTKTFLNHEKGADLLGFQFVQQSVVYQG
jgi:hypothetical protein